MLRAGGCGVNLLGESLDVGELDVEKLSLGNRLRWSEARTEVLYWDVTATADNSTQLELPTYSSSSDEAYQVTGIKNPAGAMYASWRVILVSMSTPSNTARENRWAVAILMIRTAYLLSADYHREKHNPEPRKDGIEPTSDGDGRKEVASVFAGTHLLSTANCPHRRPRFPNTTDIWTVDLLFARMKVVIYLFPFFPYAAWWSSTPNFFTLTRLEYCRYQRPSNLVKSSTASLVRDLMWMWRSTAASGYSRSGYPETGIRRFLLRTNYLNLFFKLVFCKISQRRLSQGVVVIPQILLADLAHTQFSSPACQRFKVDDTKKVRCEDSNCKFSLFPRAANRRLVCGYVDNTPNINGYCPFCY
ncbi:hypothetical protein EDD85DRAFT_789679 [Armillaria nabsnona]|nr:hypothetical protein EDD85DRAFT_789679 [Armillaria nabsnona]